MRWNRHSRNLSPRKLLRNVYRYEKIILKFTIKDWTVLLSQIFCLCVFRSQNPILIIFREREIWKTYFPLNQVKITGSYFNSSGVLVRKDSSIGPSQKTSHVTELGITNPIKKKTSVETGYYALILIFLCSVLWEHTFLMLESFS